MLNQISTYLKQKLQFNEDDTILLNGKHFPINKSAFKEIDTNNNQLISTPITFIDGGQAEILSAANFSLSFIRVIALTFNGSHKSHIKKEFFILTTASYDKDIVYTSKLFGDRIIHEEDLQITSTDTSIRNGQERAAINQVANIARRFAELRLASKATTSVVLDGTLQPTYPHEEKYHTNKSNLSALAKSTSLFTTSGNNPNILLKNLGPTNPWIYPVTQTTSFVKLHQNAKHVFRFEGDTSILPSLSSNSSDPLFLGYPYGLLLADKLARVTNTQKKSLHTKFILSKENTEIAAYLQTTDAHDILDSLG